MRLIWAQIEEVIDTGRGIQRLSCRAIDPIADIPNTVTALHYLDFGPACAAGQLVLINIITLGAEVGSNDVAFVIPSTSAGDSWMGVKTNLDDSLQQGDSNKTGGFAAAVRIGRLAGEGRAVKLGNMPLERQVMAVDEPFSPYHEALKEAVSLNAVPVVCCATHYQVPLVAATIKYFDASARVVFCMSDETGLSLGYSDEIAFCVENSLIDATVSCGQAMGGDFEAVNIYSGLLAGLYAANADYLICSVGVGDYDMETVFGHIGVAQAEALNAVAVLEGTPIAVLRINEPARKSQVNLRTEVSGQSLFALSRITMAESLIALPDDIPLEALSLIYNMLAREEITERHHVIEIPSGLGQIDMNSGIARALGMGMLGDSIAAKSVMAAARLAVYWSRSEHDEFALPSNDFGVSLENIPLTAADTTDIEAEPSRLDEPEDLSPESAAMLTDGLDSDDSSEFYSALKSWQAEKGFEGFEQVDQLATEDADSAVLPVGDAIIDGLIDEAVEQDDRAADEGFEWLVTDTTDDLTGDIVEAAADETSLAAVELESLAGEDGSVENALDNSSIARQDVEITRQDLDITCQDLDIACQDLDITRKAVSENLIEETTDESPYPDASTNDDLESIVALMEKVDLTTDGPLEAGYDEALSNENEEPVKLDSIDDDRPDEIAGSLISRITKAFRI
ncbi:MAG: DUF3866 family protein [Coriobacteriia bacterium]|nr:DUF3866 family protein [Coriobacteriia bacterium]